jgi:hypothetical protein
MSRLLICLVALVIGATVAHADEDKPRPPIGPVLEQMLVHYIRPGYTGSRWPLPVSRLR